MATSTIKKDVEWVKKSGDTMSGNLEIKSNDSSTYVLARNTVAGNAEVHMAVTNSGSHGLFSNGYYNGSEYVNAGEWMIMRNAVGKVTVADTKRISMKTFSYTTGTQGETVGQANAILYECDQSNVIGLPYQGNKVQFIDIYGDKQINKTITGTVFYLE